MHTIPDFAITSILALIISSNHMAEGLALLTSLLFIKSLQKGKLISLPFFLAFILLVELTSSYLTVILGLKNKWLYNLSIPLEYSWYLYLYWLHSGKLLKKATIISAGIIAAIAIFDFIFYPFVAFHRSVLIAGQASTIICSCIYIYELFQFVEDQPLYQNYFFWMASGLLLFNLADISFFGLYQTIVYNRLDPVDQLFRLINNNMLLVLYLSYICGILIFSKYGITENE